MRAKVIFLQALFLIAFVLPGVMQAQSAKVSEYDNNVATEAYASIASTGSAWTAAEVAQGYAGFEMPFGISFGKTAVAAGDSVRVLPNGTIVFANLNGSEIAPMKHSYSNATSETLIYTVVDTTGVTVEWLNATAGTATLNFQAKILPNGTVQFCYGSMNVIDTIEVFAGLRSSATDIYRLCGPSWETITRSTAGNDARFVTDSNNPQGYVYSFFKPACLTPDSTAHITDTACDIYRMTVVDCDGNFSVKEFVESGVYTERTFDSVSNSDIYTELTLTIKQSTYFTEQYGEVCSPYTWNVRTDVVTVNAISDTVVSMSYLNATGCYDICVLRLHDVVVPSFDTIADIICASETVYNNHGFNFTIAGTDTVSHTMANANGCDSTTTLALTVLPVSNGVADTVVLCFSAADTLSAGTYFFEYGADTISFTAAAIGTTQTATVVRTSANGCDSIVTVPFFVKGDINGAETAVACVSYTWYDSIYTASTVAIHRFAGVASNGCDSIAVLNLTIKDTTATYETTEVCSEYTYQGQLYRGNNTFREVYTGVNGCDSMHFHTFTVNEGQIDYEYAVANRPYTFDGRSLSATGTYYQLRPGMGAGVCDSLTVLHLTYIDTVEVCNNMLPYTNSELHLTVEAATGTYDESYTVADTTYAITYVVKDTVVRNIALTECDSYTWHDTAYTATGTYSYEAGIAANGCDSTEVLALTVNTRHEATFNVYACDSLVWQGETLKISGTYHDTIATAAGCDSLMTLNLTVMPDTIGSVAEACDTYTWESYGDAMGTYTTTGVYYLPHTLSAEYGSCAVVDTLTLTIHNSYAVNDTLNRTGFPYIFNGPAGDTNIVNPTLYSYAVETLHTVAGGCDSVVTRFLNVQHPVRENDYHNACVSLTWKNGHIYEPLGYDEQAEGRLYKDITSGEYVTVDSMPEHRVYREAVNGIDSIYSLVLTIGRDTVIDATAALALANEPVLDWNGTIFTFEAERATMQANEEKTVAREVHYGPTVDGIYCDSVIRIAVTITNNYDTTTMYACAEHESIAWAAYDTTYAIVGADIAQEYYFDTLDDLGRHTLHVIQPAYIYSTDHQTACDSYVWNGIEYREAGSYVNRLSTVAGCDSVVTLELTINHNAGITTVADVCDSYEWTRADGSKAAYTETIDTTYSYADANGCMGADTLRLTVRHSSDSAHTVAACESYYWTLTDSTYTESNLADTVMLTNFAGCDSMVTLHLTVNYNSSADESAVACDSYAWINHGDTLTYTATGIYLHNYTTEAGCASTDTLKLTVNNNTSHSTTQTACESYAWTTGDTVMILTVGGTYYNNYETAEGCASSDTLELTVNYATNRADTAVACESYTWQHGDGSTATIAYDQYESYPIDTIYTYIDANGCSTNDSLHLTLNTGVRIGTHTVADVCDEYVWTVDGVAIDTLSASVQTRHTLVDAESQCPIYHYLDLTVRHSTTAVEAAVACDTFLWAKDSTLYTESNDSAFVVIENAAGCDSTITLNLTVNHNSNTAYDSVVCDSMYWHGTKYDTTGIYTYDYLTADGCASTDTLHLTVNRSVYPVIDTVVCDSYMWQGNAVITTGTYTYTDSAAACTHFETLHIVVKNGQRADTAAVACESYLWRGAELTATGDYNDTTLLANGCDSVVTLHLTVNAADATTVEAEACESYTWDLNGTTYTASTDSAAVTLTNAAGCDSVVTLHLTVNHATVGTDVQTACDSYTWIDGVTYTADNSTATYTLTDANGCDSVVTLSLTVKSSNAGIETVEACDSYLWADGNTYTADNNTATRTLTNVDGCDSVVTLHLTIKHSTTGIDIQTACDSYTWADGNTYTADNSTATRTLTAANGCDSVVTLALTVNHSSSSAATVAACESYTWIDGNTYTANGTATYTVRNVAGCDSVMTLNLTINHATTGSESITVCDSYTWADGNTYTTSGAYTRTLTDVNGCDSVVTLNLTVNNTVNLIDSVVACGSYVWADSVTYTASTSTATRTLANADGCDTVVTLHLTVNYATIGIDVQTACDSYTWVDGVTYTASTDSAVMTLTGANGCDSVVTLHLTVNASDATTESAEACGSYTWTDGTTYTASGIYSRTLTNMAGCDSVVTLNLTVNTATAGTDVQTACDSYTWINGVTYTANTTATHTITNAAGCDSVVTLQLTVNRSSEGEESAVACASYAWNGRTLTATGDYTHTLVNAAGCDSVATLHLTVNSPVTVEESVVWNYATNGGYYWPLSGETYVAEGSYEATVAGINGECDTTYVMTLTFSIDDAIDFPVIYSTIGKILKVDMTRRGADLYVENGYTWYKKNETTGVYEAVAGISGANYSEDGALLNGSYYATVTIEGHGVHRTNTVTLVNGNVGIDDLSVEVMNFTVSPNPARANGQVRVSTNLNEAQLAGATLVVYDLQGREVLRQSMEQSAVLIAAPATSGIYTVRVMTANGESCVKKVIVK